MGDKLNNPLLKSIVTSLFVVISYIISDYFLITNYFTFLSGKPWSLTVSIALYTGVFNGLFSWFLDSRTVMEIEICEKGDSSQKIVINDSPRIIEASIRLSGNVKKLPNKKVLIEFPEWIDSTLRGDPAIRNYKGKNNIYQIDISEKKLTFELYITINPLYKNVSREDDTKVTAPLNFFKYSKKIKELNIKFKA